MSSISQSAPDPETNPAAILLVEDDPSIRKLFRRVLERGPWAVTDADSGQQALERLAEMHPDLIILDLMMPEMNGFELLKILNQQPNWKNIPTIVITTMPLSREKQAQLGPNVKRVLSKGDFSHRDLLDTVHQFI